MLLLALKQLHRGVCKEDNDNLSSGKGFVSDSCGLSIFSLAPYVTTKQYCDSQQISSNECPKYYPQKIKTPDFSLLFRTFQDFKALIF